jgi:hypothetical protein
VYIYEAKEKQVQKIIITSIAAEVTEFPSAKVTFFLSVPMTLNFALVTGSINLLIMFHSELNNMGAFTTVIVPKVSG